MKKKASPSDASALIPLTREAGRRAVLKSLYAGLTVYGSENGVIVGYDFSSHPITKDLEVGAKLEDHPKSNY